MDDGRRCWYESDWEVRILGRDAKGERNKWKAC